MKSTRCHPHLITVSDGIAAPHNLAFQPGFGLLVVETLALFRCGFLVPFLFCFVAVMSPAGAEGERPDGAVATNIAGPTWSPGPHDAIVAETIADMLHEWQYTHKDFDAKLSAQFYTNYLDFLDPQHLFFFQTDLAEFDKYRTALGDLTRKGDTTPAYVIFNRFMERHEQETAYVAELLQAGPPDFTSEEEMLINRKSAPYPANLEEARQLWRQHLRYDYLQEKLPGETPTGLAGQILSRHNPVALALAWHDINSNIVDGITRRNNRIARNLKDWDSDKVLETYLTCLGHVYDPHTDYMDKPDLENFAIQMTGTLFGIGATLTLSDEGYTTITDLIPSGPAAKSKKLKVNDRIVAVAQGTNELVDVKDMPLNNVVDNICDPKGTEVRLAIIPADAAISTTVPPSV